MTLSELIKRDDITAYLEHTGTVTTEGSVPVTFDTWRMTLKRTVDGTARTLEVPHTGGEPWMRDVIAGLVNDACVYENAAEIGGAEGIDYMAGEYDMPMDTPEDQAAAQDTFMGIKESADGFRAFLGDDYHPYLDAENDL